MADAPALAFIDGAELAADEERAMEERFEIEARQPWQNTVRSRELGRPKQWRRQETSQKDGPNQVGKESGSVLQAC